jgi:hypothetical protein
VQEARVSDATSYNWKASYDGFSGSKLKPSRELEATRCSHPQSVLVDASPSKFLDLASVPSPATGQIGAALIR